MKRYLAIMMAVLLVMGLVPAYASADSSPLGGWTARTSGSTDTIYGIAYGNGLFVAGGDRIITSADGVTWNTVTSPPGFSFIASMIYGNGLFVGVGWSGNLMTSPDGSNWTMQASGTSGVVRDVVYANNLYVAVGDSGYVSTSTDGVTWTGRTSGISSSLNRITYGNGMYVAAGDSGKILTSADGINWTARTSGSTNQLYGAAYGNGMFVVTGYEELILTSTDGVTWTERQRIPGTNPMFPIAYAYYRVMYNAADGLFVIAGQLGKVLTSSDGIAWTLSDTGLSGWYWSLAYGAGSYLVGGGGGVIRQTTTVNAATPSIGTQPADKSVNQGDASPTLTVVASSTDGGTLSYQWYSNATNSHTGGTLINGETNASFDPPTASIGTTYYYVVVTNTNGSVDGVQTAKQTSNAAAVTVNAVTNAAAPSIDTQPNDQTVLVNGTSPTLTVAATSTDGGTLSYQWYSNAINSHTGGTLINGETGASFDPPTTSAGTTYYYVVVTNTNSGVNGMQTATATSAAVQVTVNALVNAAAPLIGTQPSDQIMQQNDASPTLSVTATSTDGGMLSYQWYSHAVNSNTGGTLISGATNASYDPPTASVGATYYYVVVTNTNGGVSGTQTATLASQAARVTVNAVVSFNSNGGSAVNSQTVSYNGTASAPASPDKTGYTFAGWYSDSGLTNAFDFTSPITASLTLYAKWESSMSLLSGLVTDISSISPAFSAADFAYQVHVDTAVTSLHLLLTKGDAYQTLSVTGATYDSVTANVYDYLASNLVVGANTVEIELTAQNGVSHTYTVTINRTTNGNADLSGLTLSGAALTPVFAPNTIVYKSRVGNGISRTAVTATAADPAATISINGNAVASGLASNAISLNVGSNAITIVVTAQDSSTRTYTLNVTRDAASVPDSSSGASGSGSSGNGTGSGSSNGGTDTPAGPTDSGEPANPQNPGNQENPSGPKPSAESPFQNAVIPADSVVQAVKLALSRTANVTTVFTDTSDHWGADDVKKAVKLGIVEGSGDGAFHPDAAVTRAEFATMIFHAFGLQEDGDPASFGDTGSHWASGYIGALASLGIINGYEDGSFRPDASISRAEMVIIFSRVLNLGLMATGATDSFEDVSGDYWAKDAIQQAYDARLVNGVTSTTFEPQSAASRIEAVSLIIRALESDSSIKDLIADL
ncbi:S-layer homology domain-containing protein [Paenibacillus athensensis]|nr:S-layer homology domain-containing protein [Paenibacillus athensensis]MCD1261707.1 S-layer homology domain-containing protein [Paenibacillus athensensis]